MDIYGSLFKAIEEEYDTINLLKTSPKGSVSVIRHRSSGARFLLRNYTGSCEVYQKLLPITSPHLPQIMEAVQQGENAIVIEEYIQGDTLSSLLECSVLTPAQTRKITKQLCSALWILHSMGAVHRDVKPENVILRGNEAVLLDFDASRLIKQEQRNDTKVLGTIGYAAPEQYGISQTDGRADIYALGVMINIMLTGKHPSQELAGGRMGKIVQRCTMMNPEKRFRNMLHLMEAL